MNSFQLDLNNRFIKTDAMRMWARYEKSADSITQKLTKYFSFSFFATSNSTSEIWESVEFKSLFAHERTLKSKKQ